MTEDKRAVGKSTKITNVKIKPPLFSNYIKGAACLALAGVLWTSYLHPDLERQRKELVSTLFPEENPRKHGSQLKDNLLRIISDDCAGNGVLVNGNTIYTTYEVLACAYSETGIYVATTAHPDGGFPLFLYEDEDPVIPSAARVEYDAPADIARIKLAVPLAGVRNIGVDKIRSVREDITVAGYFNSQNWKRYTDVRLQAGNGGDKVIQMTDYYRERMKPSSGTPVFNEEGNLIALVSYKSDAGLYCLSLTDISDFDN